MIPFLICILLAGAPLFYLETILGQFSGKSPLALFGQLCPAFRGLGISCTLLSGILCLHYMPLTWSLAYLFTSFNAEVPWTHCHNEWNTERCYDPAIDVNFTLNGTGGVSPAEEFWK